MKKLTVHDILGTVEGLNKFSTALAEAAQGRSIESRGEVGVLADPVALAGMAVWMQEAADELKELVPDGPLRPLTGSKVRHKTLVRVIAADANVGGVRAVLPGWNPDEVVTTLDVPASVAERLDAACPSEDQPIRVTAWVNLGAASADELEFSDWDIE